jgi:predicted Zn finger-like uncharacterized protein
MIIVCPSCQARYKFDESKLGDRPKARTKCAKCGGAIDIENPLLAAMTLPPAAAEAAAEPDERTKTRRSLSAEEVGSSTITARDLHKIGRLELPRDKRFSLAVIQGAATGQIHQIAKSRTTIGRSGSDINLDDPEASRQHAAVEIFADHVLLRDLGSTNGTFVDLERIEQQVLTNQMEFRIGSHVLMFIVTEVE